MKIFYHNDLDGKCAAFWVMCSTETQDKRINLHEINYGMHFPIDEIKENEEIYIVDYSITPAEMEDLLKITNNVTWIDHHISAIKRYKDFPYKIRGVRHDGIAGCMLTYCYLNHMTNLGKGEIKKFNIEMTDKAPLFTKLIADYDVWTFEYGNNTRKFQIGFNALYEGNPNDKIWSTLLKDDYIKDRQRSLLHNILQCGTTMLKYRDSLSKKYCDNVGYSMIFEGYKCFVINVPIAGSEWFKSVDVDDYDMLISFSYNGCDWNYSLRSEKIDVSQVAMKYGGGGHKGAAGFRSKEFLL